MLTPAEIQATVLGKRLWLISPIMEVYSSVLVHVFMNAYAYLWDFLQRVKVMQGGMDFIRPELSMALRPRTSGLTNSTTPRHNFNPPPWHPNESQRTLKRRVEQIDVGNFPQRCMLISAVAAMQETATEKSPRPQESLGVQLNRCYPPSVIQSSVWKAKNDLSRTDRVIVRLAWGGRRQRLGECR